MGTCNSCRQRLTDKIASTEPVVPSMKVVSFDGSDIVIFLNPSFIFYNKEK